MYAPSAACFFAFRIGDRKPVDAWPPHIAIGPETEPLAEGADGDGAHVREMLGMPEGASERRKRYRSKEKLAELTFEKGRLYEADFFNPYIDFGTFSLKLPGLTIHCLKYINDKTHKLRYVFKNGATGEIYFCVILTLLFGDDLQQELSKEEVRWKAAAVAAAAEAGVEKTEGDGTSADTGHATNAGLGTEKTPGPDVEKYYVSNLLSSYQYDTPNHA
jgi:hypothetical protein